MSGVREWLALRLYKAASWVWGHNQPMSTEVSVVVDGHEAASFLVYSGFGLGLQCSTWNSEKQDVNVLFTDRAGRPGE